MQVQAYGLWLTIRLSTLAYDLQAQAYRIWLTIRVGLGLGLDIRVAWAYKDR